MCSAGLRAGYRRYVLCRDGRSGEWWPAMKKEQAIKILSAVAPEAMGSDLHDAFRDGAMRFFEALASAGAFTDGAHQWQRRPGKAPEHERPIECKVCGSTDIKDDGRPGSTGICPGPSS